MTQVAVRCPNCSELVDVRIFSAGLSDVIPFTCPADSTVLTVSLYDKLLPSILGGYPTTGWSASQFRAVEARLRPCPCGGKFRHDVLPKYPRCSADLHVTGLGKSEFVVVGELIDGATQSPWA